MPTNCDSNNNKLILVLAFENFHFSQLYLIAASNGSTVFQLQFINDIPHPVGAANGNKNGNINKGSGNGNLNGNKWVFQISHCRGLGIPLS